MIISNHSKIEYYHESMAITRHASTRVLSVSGERSGAIVLHVSIDWTRYAAKQCSAPSKKMGEESMSRENDIDGLVMDQFGGNAPESIAGGAANTGS